MKKILFSKVSVLVLLAGIGVIVSCKKDFLNKKPSTDLVVPSTLADFQSLLDNDNIMRETPELGELSTDDYYLTYSYWPKLNAKEHNAYIWVKDIYGGQKNVEDWDLPYQQVFYANVVLEGLQKITTDSGGDGQQWRTLYGAACFIRAYAFYNLAQVFAPAYDSAISAEDDKLGIPLRLKSDVNLVVGRATVKETYNQIKSDLWTANRLLPLSIPQNSRNRPSRPAALAMLARVCLSMRVYDSAGIYANNCLQLYNTLIDYNKIGGVFPFSKTNAEMLYQSNLWSQTLVLIPFGVADCIVDSVLYRSYDPADLRRTLYYTSTSSGAPPYLRWNYSGTTYIFSGLATDELYLTRAECAARAGSTALALSDLNELLINRWKTDSFAPVVAPTAAAALDSVLLERRKELAFRGTRWTDLRRLNKEGAAIGLTRKLNGQTYQLLPNGPRYVLPIPPDVLRLSNIPDNP
jgi:hypothetical protein